MRVELSRRDVGVPQHLLDRPQVAAAGQEMGRKAVAEGVRAHLAVEPDVLGVALDDLVEALASESTPAEVDEQLGLGRAAHELGTTRAQVAAHSRSSLPAERHGSLLGPLAVRARKAALDVDVADLEADRLRCAEAAAVHELQERAVAQRDRVGLRDAL